MRAIRVQLTDTDFLILHLELVLHTQTFVLFCFNNKGIDTWLGTRILNTFQRIHFKPFLVEFDILVIDLIRILTIDVWLIYLVIIFRSVFSLIVEIRSVCINLKLIWLVLLIFNYSSHFKISWLATILIKRVLLIIVFEIWWVFDFNWRLYLNLLSQICLICVDLLVRFSTLVIIQNIWIALNTLIIIQFQLFWLVASLVILAVINRTPENAILSIVGCFEILIIFATHLVLLAILTNINIIWKPPRSQVITNLPILHLFLERIHKISSQWRNMMIRVHLKGLGGFMRMA